MGTGPVVSRRSLCQSRDSIACHRLVADERSARAEILRALSLARSAGLRCVGSQFSQPHVLLARRNLPLYEGWQNYRADTHSGHFTGRVRNLIQPTRFSLPFSNSNSCPRQRILEPNIPAIQTNGATKSRNVKSHNERIACSSLSTETADAHAVVIRNNTATVNNAHAHVVPRASTKQSVAHGRV